MHADRIVAAERKRDGYLELAAEGFMGRDELRSKLAELEETTAEAEREIAAIRGRAERLEALKRDRDEVLASYAGEVPERLKEATPETRNRVYRMLGLRVTAAADRALSARGRIALPPFPSDSEPSPTSSPSRGSTWRS